MPSSFFGLEVAKRGIVTQRFAENIISHNIANANTKGYSRQVPRIYTTLPFSQTNFNREVLTAAQVGTGSELKFIEGIRDKILEIRITETNWEKSYGEVISNKLSEMESILNSPDSPSLSNSLNKFWDVWYEISNNPDNLAIRRNLINVTKSLTGEFHFLNDRINSLLNDIDNNIKYSVNEINNLAEKIKNINLEIFKALAIKENPNDLIDKRNLYLKELAKYTDFQINEMNDGIVRISIDGHVLVGRDYIQKLHVERDTLNNNFYKVVFEDGADALITKGEIGGFTNVRDNFIMNYRDKLNNIVNFLITEINNLHRNGYSLNSATPSNIDFFTGTDISNIDINSSIDGDPSLIAAAQNPVAPGDGTNALNIAQIKDLLLMNGGTETINEYYSGIVSEVGSDKNRMDNYTQIYDSVKNELNFRRESLSGVSLDEEMTELIKYQHAYVANTKVMKVQDDLLESIINMI